ncbi:hypothetical protein H0H87_003459 [Tephrocybe sp. NHM501043]|nr:hypothetical protein H0H87_003459 [Tephrocybe sp. NHM501043]
MALHSSRTTSSGSLIPFRFSSRSDDPQKSGWVQGSDGTDSFSNGRARRASTQSSYKGKDSAYENFSNGRASPTTTPFPFTSGASFSPSRLKSSHAPLRPSTADAMTMKRARGSIFGAASDALTFKFGRRRPPIVRQPPPMPLILPGVIEISASRRDEEDEERDRLREVAAHSLGLQVIPSNETHSLDESLEEAEVKEEQAKAEPALPIDIEKQIDAFNFAPLSPKGSVHSVVPPSPAPLNRLRSGSLLAHSRANSISIPPTPPIPPFPATFTVIDHFQQCGTMLYKYYHSSSLRIFALSKNWRHRFMVLSSPTKFVTRNSGPSVSYLHLFKSSAGEEKEIERLEINEDSVVFIAEEEVGGRKHVVKVGGVDVGAIKKELNAEEAGRTMWFLYITDATEAQKWITVIKTAILGQRTVRAGLGLPTLGSGGVEPRGDMDVMLSMRAQGLITPPITAKPTLPQNSSSQNGTATPDRNYAPSISSQHSQATVARSGTTGAVSALKGLFNGSTRPRSGSRATSIDSQHDRDRDPQEESFGSMGNHLLGRPAAADTTLRPHSVTTHASLPISGSSVLLPEHRLERKIASDRPVHWGSPSSSTVELPPVKADRNHKSLSLGALSLQPPPRKRWTSAGPARPGPDSIMHGSEESANVSIPGEIQTGPPLSPSASSFAFGTPEHRPKEPSIKSVSTLASADNSFSAEKTSTSTKRSSRRWSRQLGILPRRLSPPSGPPPSIPTNQGPAGQLSAEISIAQSETGSTHSAVSQKSFVSSLPSFSKRASAGSSLLSASGSVQTPAVSHPSSTQSHRLSVPPQRPPPTSALPPAPDQKVGNADDNPSPSSKPSFRDSVTTRAFRLSLIAPKPPPSSVLPARPDETPPQPPKSHRRNSSIGNYSQQPTTLESIPASPVPPTPPPFPPPIGPLPPTPTSPHSPTTSRPSRPLSRHIKKRLRILSAPSSTAATSAQFQTSPSAQSQPTDNVLNGVASLRRPLPTITPTSTSPPATPIAEKITLYQNDPSFLQINTPVIPHLLPPRALPVPPEPHPEIMSLSPPPRRGSKQISVIGSDADLLAVEDDKLPLDGERRLMSLSRPGSVVSLGIVSV